MRRFGLALAALALMFGTTSAAHAQDKAKADAAPKAISKDQITRGMKEAPAAVQAAKVACTVSNAAYLGQVGKGAAYEVACKEGLGYVLITSSGEPTKAYDCLHTLGQGSLQCRLPENADPKVALGPMLAANGHPCTIKDGRFIGGNKDVDIYEAACQEGPGYVLEEPAPGLTTPATVRLCVETLGDPTLECKLTTKAQSVAAIGAIAARSGRTCQVSDARAMRAATSDGSVYYEVACGEHAGFVVQADSKGAFVAAIDCSRASNIAGGCTMTDPAKAAADEASTYTARAKTAGYNCDVSKYRLIGSQGGAVHSDVVELACSNRPDGVIAIFPQSAGGKTRFVDCARAEEFGDKATCTLSSLAPVYAKYTQALVARGRTTCQVSGTHFLGHSPSGTDFIETACADGKPGWVVELEPNDAVKTLLSCGQAKGDGLVCTLPTNTRR